MILPPVSGGEGSVSMQILYSVSVEAIDPSAQEFDKIRELVADWSFGAAERPETLLGGQGSADVEGKRLSWHALDVAGSADTSRLWTIEVCSPLQGAPGSEFVCAVNVTLADKRVGLHIDLGRRSPGAVVAPTPLEFFDRPRLVPAVLSSVPCRYGPAEPVSASPKPVRASEIDSIRELLDAADRRLPTLVVSSTHPASPEARFAHGAADRLAGLAHVVLLETWLALDALMHGTSSPCLMAERACSGPLVPKPVGIRGGQRSNSAIRRLSPGSCL